MRKRGSEIDRGAKQTVERGRERSQSQGGAIETEKRERQIGERDRGEREKEGIER